MSLLEATPAELRLRFEAVATRQAIAALVEISYSRIAYVVHTLAADVRYRAFTIKKRNGGSRRILEPTRTLKIAQQRLNQVFQAVYLPKPSTHGFVRQRTVVSNAQVHVGKNYVFNVDLDSFFPSINFGRIRGMFMAYPYHRNSEVATFLAQICCHENELPQGAPTSPVLANMICAKMDAELQRLAKRHRCYYTRYADDLTFSTSYRGFPVGIGLVNRSEEQPVTEVGPELRQIIESNGFAINPMKVRLQNKHRRQEVTGILVNAFPNVSRKYVRQVRAMLYAWGQHGYSGAQAVFNEREYDRKDRGGFARQISYKDVVRGKIDFLMMVRGAANPIVQRFYREYGRLDPHAHLPFLPPVTPSDVLRIQDALWVLECEETSSQGTAFALRGYGLVTCEHVLGTQTHAFRPDNPTLKYPVTVVKRSSALDLAVLEIEALDLRSLRKGASNDLVERSSVCLAGFPNYSPGASGWISNGTVTGFRPVSTVRRILINTPIIAGASGSPVLNSRNEVIGVAVTGADRMENADRTVDHGVIPIETLDRIDEDVGQPNNASELGDSVG